MQDLNLPCFDVIASKKRCLRMRRRILELSQKIAAVHIAPAFSCIEILDAIYFGLMRYHEDGTPRDAFILSKGHGAMAQYAILEERGVWKSGDMDEYIKPSGKLGGHPDYGIRGIEASTGSLGHGLPIALGLSLADRVFSVDRKTYVVLSDGELQEGSVWEALMLAPTLRLTQLIAFVDLNGFQSLGEIGQILPNFYPIKDKIQTFGWKVVEVDGHDTEAIIDATLGNFDGKPLMVLAHTIKGKGVSYMENVPIWHYRSPSPEEYKQALHELSGEER